jgi:hypothetical protein
MYFGPLTTCTVASVLKEILYAVLACNSSCIPNFKLQYWSLNIFDLTSTTKEIVL